jgi:hypothetical protein
LLLAGPSIAEAKPTNAMAKRVAMIIFMICRGTFEEKKQESEIRDTATGFSCTREAQGTHSTKVQSFTRSASWKSVPKDCGERFQNPGSLAIIACACLALYIMKTFE